MVSSDQPQPSPITSEAPASTGIQTPSGITAPAEAPSIALPPAPPPPAIDLATFLAMRVGLDSTLVVLILLFAFLVASFPAGNPDFFTQAATGRMILNGEYHFGVDPFVYSTSDTDYFVNHSWLFAVLMYVLYQIPSIGGAIVVIFKALLIAVLAGVIFRAGRRPGQSPWIAATCTALAILVLSPRVHLQSTCLSYLFLGVTLWLLLTGRRERNRLWWLLPPLFALWVNCDQWFFLGPLTLALYLAGEVIQLYGTTSDGGPAPARPHELRTLSLVLVIGVAACLLSPHHIHAFTLPPELGLSPASDLIEQDPQFHSLFLSPLRKDYYLPHLGLNAAGLAYWPMLLVGLASFAFVFGRAPWWRLTVWICFALMSLYNVRAIPFFAIVSGPIMSLNWQDYATQLLGTAPRLTTAWRNWSLGGRALTVLLALALVIVAVPGLLQAQPRFRQLGWSVYVNPALKDMAETIRDWRQSGKLGRDEPNWFNTHTEVANYVAYFAPGERVYLDQALPHFRKAAEDYEAIRVGLDQMVRQPTDEDTELSAVKTDFRQILRDHHVRFWIFDNFIFENLDISKPEMVARFLLFRSPNEWVLCHLKGRIAIFAWRDPKQREASDPSGGLALDLKRAAFGPEAEQAPKRGPEPAASHGWLETCLDYWWPAPPSRSVDADSAALYELRFRVVELQEQIAKHTQAWRGGMAAAAVAGALSSGPVPNNLVSLNWCWSYNEFFPGGAVGQVPPVRSAPEQLARSAWDFYLNTRFYETPSLYLAVRAARRALVANPDDGPTYLRLGQTYQRLRNLPQEGNLATTAPLLAALRRTQLIAALQNAVRLQQLDAEKEAQAHEALFDLYSRKPPHGLGYIDASVHHFREAVNKRTAAGPQPGISAAQHDKMIESMNSQLAQMDAEREKHLDRYDLNSAGKTGLEKVRIALQEGLSETALAALEEVGEANVNNPAEVMLVKQVTVVALDLGRLDKARELLPDPEGEPVKLEDLNLYLLLAAARGDYEEAERLLSDALVHAWQPAPGQPVLGGPELSTALMIGRVLQNTALAGTRTTFMTLPVPRPILPSNFWIRRWRLEAVVNGMVAVQQRAEWYLLRAWFALEAGHCVEARKHFQTVRDITVIGDEWGREVSKVNAWLDDRREIPQIQQLSIRHAVFHELSVHYLKWLVEEQ
jgi:hypothetical protein